MDEEWQYWEMEWTEVLTHDRQKFETGYDRLNREGWECIGQRRGEDGIMKVRFRRKVNRTDD